MKIYLKIIRTKGTFYTPKESYILCAKRVIFLFIEELKAKCSKEELTEIHTLVFENGKVDLKVIEKFADDLDGLYRKLKSVTLPLAPELFLWEWFMKSSGSNIC